MMVPAQKAALARSLAVEDKALPPQEYMRILRQQLGPVLALQDDPHFKRVKRQLDQWLAGPPEGWEPPMAVDPMTGQPVVDPQTGEPQPDLQNDPVLKGIFAPRAVDLQQDVAMTRLTEIGRVMATSKYDRFPAPWQKGLELVYEAARQAAGVATVGEQQQAAQQQAQGQGEAAQIKAAADVEKAKIQSETDLATAELKKQGELLDVRAARAGAGGRTLASVS